MTTTLLLACSCGHIAIFILFMAKGLSAANILNAPSVAAEILNILVGSFGLVTFAPFKAVIAGLLYRLPRQGTETAAVRQIERQGKLDRSMQSGATASQILERPHSPFSQLDCK